MISSQTGFVPTQADADKPAVIGYFDLATSDKEFDVFEKVMCGSAVPN